MNHLYVGICEEDPYQKISLYNENGKPVRQVLWGDWLTIASDADLGPDKQHNEKWIWVKWAWKDEKKRQLLKIKRKETSASRPLEIIFLDVGIGDGSVFISPERAVAEAEDPSARGQERIVIIDAGKSEHMREFLDSRFKTYRNSFHFHAAVITHPDLDHYQGFGKIFSNKNITFDHVYHNGIVEIQTGNEFERVGGTTFGTDGTVKYIRKIFETDADIRAIYSDGTTRNNSFSRVIRKAIEKKNVAEFKMLGRNVGPSENGKYWVPGFAPSSGGPYTIEVLGPWVEYPFADGKPHLRVFSDDLGKTKNGHSILLRLEYNGLSVLFGGDLNKPAEMFLLKNYAGIQDWPSNDFERGEMIAKASESLSSDVMKACHHGAADVTDEFLKAVEPSAFVISSGDEDVNYVHPRPDLLGRLGKSGYGKSPVLLSTELQRSTRDIDNRKPVEKLKKEVLKLLKSDPAEPNRLIETEKLLERLGQLALPSVSVDGAIYVKTNGDFLVTAFKKETQDPKHKWFYYVYRLSGDGNLTLIERNHVH